MIEWHDEIPQAINGNKRAEETLKALRLGAVDRDGLVESRRQHLMIVKSLVDSLVFTRTRPESPEALALTEDLQKQLKKAASPAGKYCAMIRARLRSEGVSFNDQGKSNR
ncbi:MAG: hypothetical protein K2X03_28345 [Bryobacteraceae bacterium]|nr:hypothetical protein [Bryobacteraceae bacterium]